MAWKPQLLICDDVLLRGIFAKFDKKRYLLFRQSAKYFVIWLGGHSWLQIAFEYDGTENAYTSHAAPSYMFDVSYRINVSSQMKRK
jgi:hypothetical protein